VITRVPGSLGSGDAVRGGIDADAVALHLERALAGRHVDAHVRQALGERGAVIGGELLALVAGLARDLHGLAPARPRGGDAADVLLAVGEVEQRAERLVELVARRELGAGLVPLLLLGERLGLLEERVGRGGVAALRGGRRGVRERGGDRENGEGAFRSTDHVLSHCRVPSGSSGLGGAVATGGAVGAEVATGDAVGRVDFV
jgi:hypothetical protein